MPENENLSQFYGGLANKISDTPLESQADQLKTQKADTRPFTQGEVLVGLDFNPSGDIKVQRAKELCAELADLIFDSDLAKQETAYPYLQNTFKGDAIRNILHAQMAAVKYLTFKK